MFSQTDRFCFRFFFTPECFFLWCVSLTRLVTSLRVILMQQPTNSSAKRDNNKSSEFHIELILLGDEVDTFKFYVSSGEIFWHALIVNSTPALDIWNSWCSIVLTFKKYVVSGLAPPGSCFHLFFADKISNNTDNIFLAFPKLKL